MVKKIMIFFLLYQKNRVEQYTLDLIHLVLLFQEVQIKQHQRD